MYPEINLVAQSGIVKWPSLKYNATNRVRTLFTSVRNEADRVGATQPVGFTYVDSHALRVLYEAPCSFGCWSSRYFPNTVGFIPHRGKGCLGEGCNAKGQPEFRFTLVKAGAYPWSVPCCAIGHTAEKLAGDLDEGMPVLISAAELCYRKRETKAGEVSRLEILVRHAQVGSPDRARVAHDERIEPGEGDGDPPGRDRRA